VAGRKVRELELPRGALLTTRRRGQLLQLLGGDDLLEVGDVVFALANPESVAPLPAAFR
jgi:Trk K+ transport system NAD-binding subunit